MGLPSQEQKFKLFFIGNLTFKKVIVCKYLDIFSTINSGI